MIANNPKLSAQIRATAESTIKKIKENVKELELKINDENLTWRIIYRLYADAILILEIFEKRRTKPQNQLSMSAI